MSIKEVESKLIDMIKFAREKNDPYFELELRVGTIADDDSFVSGYDSERFNECIRRLVNRLNATANNRNDWSAEPQSTFLRSYYSGDIRGTAVPNKPVVFCRKTRQCVVDIQTNFPTGDLRMALSREVPFALEDNSEIEKIVRTGRPDSVQFYIRSRYTQRVVFHGKELIFHVDISLVSPRGKNKQQCTEKYGRYHCEVEFGSPLTPMENKAEELEQNLFIARHMSDLGRRLLGTHKITSEGLEELPVPKIRLFTRDN